MSEPESPPPASPPSKAPPPDASDPLAEVVPAAPVTPRYAWGIAKLVIPNDPEAPVFKDQPRLDELARELLTALLWFTRCPSRQEMAPIRVILEDTHRLREALATTVAAPPEAAPVDAFALRALTLLDEPAGRAARKLARESITGAARRRPPA